MVISTLKRSLIGVAFAFAAFSTALAANVVPTYKTTIKNLAPAGGIAQNPSLDQTVQTSAAEKSLITTPPALSAFVYIPTTTKPVGGYPAVVLMGGHTGIYTSGITAADKGKADKLSNRSKLWAKTLSDAGFVVVLVDDFGSYGFPQGFSVSWDKRPGWASAANARPYYVYSALNDLAVNYATTVNKSKISLLGWSNGGTTTLSAVAKVNAPIPASMTVSTAPKFAVAMALYPACGLENRYKDATSSIGAYDAKIRTVMETASADTEIDPLACTNVLAPSVKLKSNLMISEIRPNATHTYDGNNTTANAIAANVTARDYSLQKALSIFPK